ncbi:MAG TPA: glycosyltransferase, partial [Acidimicrobiales bacterium]
PERVDIVKLPFDEALVERVSGLRRSSPRQEVALYVGNLLPHKNLPRLVVAFEASRFRQGGGRLLIVGGSPNEASVMSQGLTPAQRSCVDVRPRCPQAELDRLLATSLFLVQPSLEEGFGLPAWEALCCGVPVCVSDGGALPEVVKGFSRPFPAADVEAMRYAIDHCAVEAHEEGAGRAAQSALRTTAPRPRDLAQQFQGIVASALSEMSVRSRAY